MDYEKIKQAFDEVQNYMTENIRPIKQGGCEDEKNDPFESEGTEDQFERIGVFARASQAVKAIGQNIRGVNQRPTSEIARITEICKTCRHKVAGFCAGCGCNLRQKIRNASTRCPLEPPKWGACVAADRSIGTA